MHGDGKHCLDKVVAVTPEAERMLKSQSAVLWKFQAKTGAISGGSAQNTTLYFTREGLVRNAI